MNTYSEKITQARAVEIKKVLIDKGAVFDTVQYSVWRAKTPSFQVTYYTSGKILIQGKDISGILCDLGVNSVTGANSEEINQPLITAETYIGTDESGKGDFFGPLVVAGVQVNPQNKQKFIDLGIKDSKKLDDKKILQFAGIIKANAVHSVVVMTPAKYNELYNTFKNLNKLLAWGHARAIENILEKSPCECALADKFGDESLIQNALMKKGGKITLKQAVRAEADIAVACASVLARAEFVKRTAEAERRYEMTLSKGASDKVVRQAKEFVQKYSFERLSEVAKMHFKTVNEIKS